MKNFFRVLVFLATLIAFPVVISKVKKKSHKDSLSLSDIDIPYNNKDAEVAVYPTNKDQKERTLVQFHSSAKRSQKTETLNKLSERQKELYNYITEQGSVNMAAISIIFNAVTKRTLRRDLAKLSELNLISRIGSTRNTLYSPAK